MGDLWEAAGVIAIIAALEFMAMALLIRCGIDWRGAFKMALRRVIGFFKRMAR